MDGLGEVVVKFCEQYSCEVHTVLKNAGYAPKLYFCERITSRYVAIVMEKVEGTRIDIYLQEHEDSKQEVLHHCKKAYMRPW